MSDRMQDLIVNAQRMLSRAYAPYSTFKVGACIATSKGNYFAGANVENSSYGLTLCAEASAIANMVASGEYEIADIVILSSNDELCPPCGACRQRLFEFSSPDTRIHLCEHGVIKASYAIDELLPLGFKLKI